MATSGIPTIEFLQGSADQADAFPSLLMLQDDFLEPAWRLSAGPLAVDLSLLMADSCSRRAWCCDVPGQVASRTVADRQTILC
jgi:hypothetical protein